MRPSNSSVASVSDSDVRGSLSCHDRYGATIAVPISRDHTSYQNLGLSYEHGVVNTQRKNTWSASTTRTRLKATGRISNGRSKGRTSTFRESICGNNAQSSITAATIVVRNNSCLIVLSLPSLCRVCRTPETRSVCGHSQGGNGEFYAEPEAPCLILVSLNSPLSETPIVRRSAK